MSILGWFGGNPLDKLLGAYEKHQDTAAERDKTRAKVLEAQISSELERVRLSNQVRLATAGFIEMRAITGVVAGCFALHLLLVTLDTCFAFGWKIAAFPAPFDQWQGTILLSLFGVGVASKGITAATTAFLARR
ncbi:MAG: hypothetical protein M3R04_07040 [bacterium]|nr:hypothetical protein [bacterium]